MFLKKLDQGILVRVIEDEGSKDACENEIEDAAKFNKRIGLLSLTILDQLEQMAKNVTSPATPSSISTELMFSVGRRHKGK